MIEMFNINKVDKYNNRFICYYYYQKTLIKQGLVFVQNCFITT